MIHALHEMILSGVELDFRIHIHAVEGVHQPDQRVEIDPDIVGDLDPVQVFQRLHRRLHPVYPGVRQLIPLLPGNPRDRHEVIAGCGRQQDPVRQRIHSHDDVDIAAAGRRDRAAHVDPADQHIEGVIGQILTHLFLRAGIRFFHHHLILHDHADLGGEVRDDIVQKILVSGVADHCVHIARKERLTHGDRRIVALAYELVISVLSLDRLGCLIEKRLIRALIHTEFISGGICRCICLAPVLNQHNETVSLHQIRSCDLIQCVHDVPHIDNGEQEHTAHEDRQNIAQ